MKESRVLGVSELRGTLLEELQDTKKAVLSGISLLTRRREHTRPYYIDNSEALGEMVEMLNSAKKSVKISICANPALYNHTEFVRAVENAADRVSSLWVTVGNTTGSISEVEEGMPWLGRLINKKKVNVLTLENHLVPRWLIVDDRSLLSYLVPEQEKRGSEVWKNMSGTAREILVNAFIDGWKDTERELVGTKARLL